MEARVDVGSSKEASGAGIASDVNKVEYSVAFGDGVCDCAGVMKLTLSAVVRIVARRRNGSVIAYNNLAR